MSKLIECYKCFTHLGELTSGSKVRKGTRHICPECQSTIRIMENALEAKQADNPIMQIFDDIISKQS